MKPTRAVLLACFASIAFADPPAKTDGLDRVRQDVADFEKLMDSPDPEDRRRLIMDSFMPRSTGGRGNDTPEERPAAFEPSDDEWVAIAAKLSSKSLPDETRWLVLYHLSKRNIAGRYDRFLESSLDSASEQVHTMALVQIAPRLEGKELLANLRSDLKRPGGRRQTACTVAGDRKVREVVPDLIALLDEAGPEQDVVTALGWLGVADAAAKIEARIARGEEIGHAEPWFWFIAAPGKVPAPIVDNLVGRWNDKSDPYALQYLGGMRDAGATEALRGILKSWDKTVAANPNLSGSKSTVLEALVEAGDAEAGKELLEMLKARPQGPWGFSSACFNALAAPEVYNRSCDTEYPLSSGTLAEHAAALSKWLGIPVELDRSVDPWAHGEIPMRPATRRASVALHWICLSCCPVIEKDRIRLVSTWVAAAEWPKRFAK